MSRLTSFVLLLAFALPALGGEKFRNIGREATPEEIAAWDIDVRADFSGLPKGSGSVQKGEELWEAKCASCHGSFGESNQYFPPVAGGVKREDIERGRVAALARGEQRTTMAKLSQVSTLWDYIRRAMPWNAPKTLGTDEVYALTAYILSLDKVVPEDFILTERNIAEVQKRLPNRDGMRRDHGLWDVKGKPDVQAKACMANCAAKAEITSRLPDDARGNHGNLAAQQRPIGPMRGVAYAERKAGDDLAGLAEKSGCLACHGAAARIVGPSLAEIAAKYRTDAGAESRLFTKVKDGGQGAWGNVPMPPHAHLQDSDIRSLVRWILTAQ